MNVVIVTSNGINWANQSVYYLVEELNVKAIFYRLPNSNNFFNFEKKLEKNSYFLEKTYSEKAFIKGFNSFNNDFFRNFLKENTIDYVLVLGTSNIFDKKTLEGSAKFINFHLTLLPKYRGPSFLLPIINGDKESGVTIHKLTEVIDSGDIYIQESFILEDRDTQKSLLYKLADTALKCTYSLVEKIMQDELNKIYILGLEDLKTAYQGKHDDSFFELNIYNDDLNTIDRKVRAYGEDGLIYFILNNKKIYVKKSNFIKTSYLEYRKIIVADDDSLLINENNRGLMLSFLYYKESIEETSLLSKLLISNYL